MRSHNNIYELFSVSQYIDIRLAIRSYSDKLLHRVMVSYPPTRTKS